MANGYRTAEGSMKAKAAELGFVACGFARADAAPEPASGCAQWLDAGPHGEMGWMEDRAEQRASPHGLWPEAQVGDRAGMSYAPATDPLALAERPRPRADLGLCPGRRLSQDGQEGAEGARPLAASSEAGCELKVFVDTAPVMEKPLAAAAGHRLAGQAHQSGQPRAWQLAVPRRRSTPRSSWRPTRRRSRRIAAAARAASTPARPTPSPRPYRIDARRCISYLTIEHNGPIPDEFREAIGNRIYGCDDCLAVCPWNRFAEAAAGQPRLPAARRAGRAARWPTCSALDDAGFREVFAGSPIKRIGRNRMVRNCLIAAGNSGDPALAAGASSAHLCSDPDPVVAEAARWALERLQRLRCAATQAALVDVAALDGARVDMGDARPRRRSPADRDRRRARSGRRRTAAWCRPLADLERGAAEARRPARWRQPDQVAALRPGAAAGAAAPAAAAGFGVVAQAARSSDGERGEGGASPGLWRRGAPAGKLADARRRAARRARFPLPPGLSS